MVVGCWETHTQTVHIDCYKNIIHGINSSDSIILSTCHIDLSSIETHPIQLATDDIFQHHQGVTHIREAYQLSKQHKGHHSIHPMIIDACPRERSVMLNDSWQVEYYLNRIVNADRVVVVGVGWNLGVRRDAVSWGRLCELRMWGNINSDMIIATNIESTLTNVNPSKGILSKYFKTPILENDDSWVKNGNYYYKINNIWNTRASINEHNP